MGVWGCARLLECAVLHVHAQQPLHAPPAESVAAGGEVHKVAAELLLKADGAVVQLLPEHLRTLHLVEPATNQFANIRAAVTLYMLYLYPIDTLPIDTLGDLGDVGERLLPSDPKVTPW
eukprot:4180092-Pyramimonas_sp.AAC.1